MNALRLLLTATLAASAVLAQASDAASLKAALDANGRVSVYGLNCQIMLPDTIPVLLEVQRLLEDNPDLKLRIEAHTANDGTPAANHTMSLRCLHAVRVWLFIHGVDGKRYTTQAVGDRRPIGDNATAEGRVLNRRIDLVKQ